MPSLRSDLKTIRFAIAMSFFSAFVAASAQTSAATSLTANPVYQKNCAKCHGKTAEGRHFGGPSLVSQKATTASIDDLAKIITNGKGRMPKYSGKLTPQEIDALVQQIKALSAK